MIIDPDRDGCTVWFESSGNFQSLRGTPEECINRIAKFVMSEETGQQFSDPISLDVAGPGKHYAYYFERLGIKFQVAKPVKRL